MPWAFSSTHYSKYGVLQKSVDETLIYCWFSLQGLRIAYNQPLVRWLSVDEAGCQAQSAQVSWFSWVCTASWKTWVRMQYLQFEFGCFRNLFLHILSFLIISRQNWTIVNELPISIFFNKLLFILQQLFSDYHEYPNYSGVSGVIMVMVDKCLI